MRILQPGGLFVDACGRRRESGQKLLVVILVGVMRDGEGDGGRQRREDRRGKMVTDAVR